MFDLGALVPLFRVTAFGRGYVDMELCFALFCVAGWIALWVDRPRAPAPLGRRTHRGRRGAGGRRRRGARRPGQRSATPARPRRAGCRSPFDALHLISGSIWIGGLVGLLILWFRVGAGTARARR